MCLEEEGVYETVRRRGYNTGCYIYKSVAQHANTVLSRTTHMRVKLPEE